MATPALGFDNFYSGTLTGAISASSTTIGVTPTPTAQEGYMTIEADSSTNREIVYYTSVSGGNIVLPSVGAGRGVGGTTAVAHSSGVAIKMNTVAEMFEALQDFTAMTGGHTYFKNYMFDFVYSGGVWSGDSYGSTRAASMTAMVCYINGLRISIGAVTARTFTASKDTYIDVLSNGDGTGTLVYTEATNNAASPALATNSIRIGIIVTGASAIAAATSINQGQITALLPTNSSQVLNYGLDTLGNSIFPGSPSHRKIAFETLVGSNFTTSSTSFVDVTGVTFVYKTGSRPETVYLTVKAVLSLSSAANAVAQIVINGVDQAGTLYQGSTSASNATNMYIATIPAATSATIKMQAKTDANTLTVTKSAGIIPTIRGFGTLGTL